MQNSNTPLIKHIPRFLEYCEIEKGLSPVSTRNYDNFLRMFTGWLRAKKQERIKPHELTPEHIWDYRLYLSRKQDARGRYIKKTTQNYYLIALRNLLSYFADKDIQAIPTEKIKLAKLTDKDRAIKFLSFAQIEKLMSMPNTAAPQGLRDRAILEVFFSTGTRIAELTSLNIAQFDAKNLVSGRLKEQELSITGKGGRLRTIYFSERALLWLGKYIKTRKDLFPPLFINYRPNEDVNAHRLTPRSIERMVKRYANMAGLPVSATPHTLRHSFATDLLNQGADMRAVQELLGHKNIMTTQVYTHLTNPKLKEIHKKFHSGKT
ncbi:tyrosine-type recombinase/integrase [Candidatus Uhrbacteria bacterium]|nr:tyrosine-type recombinase/integrase [Candidatus Uhrbacteria bacterium]